MTALQEFQLRRHRIITIGLRHEREESLRSALLQEKDAIEWLLKRLRFFRRIIRQSDDDPVGVLTALLTLGVDDPAIGYRVAKFIDDPWMQSAIAYSIRLRNRAIWEILAENPAWFSRLKEAIGHQARPNSDTLKFFMSVKMIASTQAGYSFDDQTLLRWQAKVIKNMHRLRLHFLTLRPYWC